MENVT